MINCLYLNKKFYTNLIAHVCGKKLEVDKKWIILQILVIGSLNTVTIHLVNMNEFVLSIKYIILQLTLLLLVFNGLNRFKISRIGVDQVVDLVAKSDLLKVIISILF